MLYDDVNCLFLLIPIMYSNPNFHLSILPLITYRKEYFQDILNRLVTTVIIGMMPPLQGASLVYNIATILGLDLLQELPQKTLIVTGMRKTNDLIRGHDFLVTAFTPFGEIEEAAIAPSNRGFGKSSHSINPLFIDLLKCSHLMYFYHLLAQALFDSWNQRQ